MQTLVQSNRSCLVVTEQVYLLQWATHKVHHLRLQDEGADIDVSALLLPEPGLASTTGLALREPDMDSDTPALQAETTFASAAALDATFEQRCPIGAADADEPDEGFGIQLAEAGKVIGYPRLQ